METLQIVLNIASVIANAALIVVLLKYMKK